MIYLIGPALVLAFLAVIVAILIVGSSERADRKKDGVVPSGGPDVITTAIFTSEMSALAGDHTPADHKHHALPGESGHHQPGAAGHSGHDSPGFSGFDGGHHGGGHH